MPEIALLVSTYQRPAHLKRALTSIALQEHVAGRFEVVVTDDGSEDETAEIVEQFSQTVEFPVRFTTHAHKDFQLARCRNEGVAASTAPYVLFLDGDCLLPPGHVAAHLARRRRGVVMGGYCCRLDRATSERITDQAIRTNEYLAWAPRSERRTLAWMDIKARFYSFIRHPTKPKLFGGNIAIWRTDYERVNGYDQNFNGWGCEDDDLRLRLRKADVHIESILRWTHTYHLWHPTEASNPKEWQDGRNVRYLHREVRLTRCRNGLRKRGNEDLVIRIVGKAAHQDMADRIVPRLHVDHERNGQADVEVLFLPGQGRFSGRADCNILVVLDDVPNAATTCTQAHFIVANRTFPDLDDEHQFQLGEFESALAAVA